MSTTIPKPRMTFRVAVAGQRFLPNPKESADRRAAAEAGFVVLRARLAERLVEVFGLITERMVKLVPSDCGGPAATGAAEYFGNRRAADGTIDGGQRPVFRVVSGLADGADQIAFEVARQFAQTLEEPAAAEPIPDPVEVVADKRPVELELVAVLPCGPAEFRDYSEVTAKGKFDALLQRCKTIIELDGKLIDDPAQKQLSESRRKRAFRAQSRVLLRQCDVLIAVPDLAKDGSAGGTRETMTAAVDLGIPVLMIALGETADDDIVKLLRQRQDIDDDLTTTQPDWRAVGGAALTRLLTDPRIHHNDTEAVDDRPLAAEEASLLDEFFGDTKSGGRFQRWLWSWFDRLVVKAWTADTKKKKSEPAVKGPGDNTLPDFQPYRTRASVLSANYAARYRGAFLLNYLFAAVAVGLAVLSLLVVIATLHGEHAEAAPLVILLVLGLFKFAALVAIYLNTRSCKIERWNEKAIDFRYLAERLRTLYYLPRTASLRPPPPKSAQYASAMLRQNIVDWLFHAIVRQAPAGTGLDVVTRPFVTAAGQSVNVSVHSPNLRAVAGLVQCNWLKSQIGYHQKSHAFQHYVHRMIEHGISVINKTVIVVVGIDLAILVLALFVDLLGIHSELIHGLHTYGPILIATAAFLPAVVASLNGFNFQSECLRIAERSGLAVKILQSRLPGWQKLSANLDAVGPTDVGSWVLQSIDLTESCAQIVTDEVAEWSVLYSRDLAEP